MSDAVLAQLAELRAQMELGFAQMLPLASATPPPPPLPLLELRDAYLLATRRTKAALTLAARTDRLRLFLSWAEGRGVTLASQLSRRLLDEYDEHLRTSGHRHALRESSRRMVMGLLLKWWWWAHDREEWTAAVPRPPRELELPSAAAASVHAPTWAQMDAVVAEMRTEGMRRAAVLLRCLGWRVRQIVRLEWRDFDFDAGTITLRGALGKSRREKAGRVVPMPRALRDEMRTWVHGRPTDRVVPKGSGNVRRAVRAAWKRTKAAPELWVQRPDHAFRRGITSELRAAGLPADSTEFWCGRRTAGESGTYTDPRSLELRRIAEAIPPLSTRARGAPLLYLLTLKAS